MTQGQNILKSQSDNILERIWLTQQMTVEGLQEHWRVKDNTEKSRTSSSQNSESSGYAPSLLYNILLWILLWHSSSSCLQV